MSGTMSAGYCEAIAMFLGIDLGTCGKPAAGQFAGACEHEHVKVRRLCREHAEASEGACCRDCYELPGGNSHVCGITVVPLAGTAEARQG